MYSYSVDKHEQILQAMLATIKEHQLYAKQSKCEFWLDRVSFFGHVVAKKDITLDPSKTKEITN